MKATIGTRKSERRTDLSEVTPLETPYVIFIDPCSACNFQCTFCPTGDLKLMRDIGRYQGNLSLDDFTKIIRDIEEFDQPIKVLRLYKDGEPLLNKHLGSMIKIAKSSKNIEAVDTTTNGFLLNKEKSKELIDAGIDLINISVDGLDSNQFLHFTKSKVDFKSFVENIKYLYSIKNGCRIVIKTTTEIIGNSRKDEFYEIFGDMCDRIFVENTSPCWPDFDVEERMGIEINEGLYGNKIEEQTACPYLFYSISVNSDMKVSACFVDWSRDLNVGNLREKSLKEIWNSKELDAHRFAHLTGLRKKHKICGKCGQISHCGPDSIENKLEIIKDNFNSKSRFQNLDDELIAAGYKR
jgi:radical SAM protein with 4Fe4S-binding SPASM domain